MKKFSIIIPTLLKNQTVLNRLLSILNRDISVGEIIVINNSQEYFQPELEKVRIVQSEKNLYVNPSWNLGIELSKYDYFGLLNDDIIIQDDFCSLIMKLIKPEQGILGIDKNFIVIKRNNFEKLDDIDFPKNKITLKKVKKREFSFGIAMFGKKECYNKIPDDIKVWYGDDYLFYTNKNNYVISGLTVYHLHELSSSDKNLKDIKENDSKLYNTFKVQSGMLNTNSLLENIFSLKNIYDKNGNKSHKTLCICGLKFNLIQIK